MDPANIPRGLYLTEEIISIEQKLINEIDSNEWMSVLKRRVQHYGYFYNYKSGKATTVAPQLIEYYGKYFRGIGIIGSNPEQFIINEYNRDQGISPHVDSLDYGPVIIGMCLGADTIMNFIHVATGETFELFLPRRCAFVMSGEVQSSWKHGIKPNKTYKHNGLTIRKDDNYRRISITYRTLTNETKARLVI